MVSEREKGGRASATRRRRGGVRERAVRAPLGLGGLLAEAWREKWAAVLGLGASRCAGLLHFASWAGEKRSRERTGPGRGACLG